MKLSLISIAMLLPFTAHAMETKKLQPSVFHKIKTKFYSDDPIVVKIKQKTDCAVINVDDTEILSHDSPEITYIHDKKYLNNLEKHPSAMLAAINNNYLISLYPNAKSRDYLKPLLMDTTITLAALKRLIENKNNHPDCKPHYAVSLGSAGSFASYDYGNKGDVYASMYIAAAHALKSKQFQRLLMIDENTSLTMDYKFFSDKLIGTFREKDYLKSKGHDIVLRGRIDLAFYNINIDKQDAKNERLDNFSDLFNRLITTLIIFSGDKSKNIDQICALLNQITEIKQDCRMDLFRPLHKNPLNPFSTSPSAEEKNTKKKRSYNFGNSISSGSDNDTKSILDLC